MEWLRKFWRRHVVAPIPEGMERCGVCNKTACDDAHFQACPSRLKPSSAPDETAPA